MNFGDGPVARNTDPLSSWEAARSVHDVTAKQAAVYKILRLWPLGLTDDEIAVRYVRYAGSFSFPFQSPSGLRTRRKELCRKGLVDDSGSRRRTASGRLAIVWIVTS